jgi:hypothetical protein
MFFSLWCRLRKRKPGLSGGKRRPGGRRPPYRPRLDPLEDRIVPTLGAGASPLLTGGPLAGTVSGYTTSPQVQIAMPAAVSGLQSGSQSSAGTNQMQVTVMENSPETVIDLGAVFGAMTGIHHEDGLQLSMLGNTNSRLVTTDLSEAALTLTYAQGKYGTATITVGATDADGVSVQEAILVTVNPLPVVGTGAAAPS